MRRPIEVTEVYGGFTEARRHRISKTEQRSHGENGKVGDIPIDSSGAMVPRPQGRGRRVVRLSPRRSALRALTIAPLSFNACGHANSTARASGDDGDDGDGGTEETERTETPDFKRSNGANGVNGGSRRDHFARARPVVRWCRGPQGRGRWGESRTRHKRHLTSSRLCLVRLSPRRSALRALTIASTETSTASTAFINVQVQGIDNPFHATVGQDHDVEVQEQPDGQTGQSQLREHLAPMDLAQFTD